MTPPPESAVRVEVRPDGIAVLTIDQPGRRANVLTRDLWADLEAALMPLAGRTDLKGLVVASGKPDVFVAGADLKFLAAVPAPNDPAVRALIEHGHRVLALLESLPFPTCAAIDGAALGGGLELALACDCRVCGTNPRVELGLPEVKLGLIPGWGGTQRLPRLVGMEAAAEMLATGDPAGREEAFRIGLAVDGDPVTVVDTHDASASRRRKRDRADGSYHPPSADGPPAVREVLAVLARGAVLPLADAIAVETEAFLRLAGSAESKRLIAEFFAGRGRG